ncbi:TPA: MspI family type II restriction endonuclease [Streptococcus suis]|nr:MspI family type II restriction endonuclease [Streptococcus suis]
MSFNFDNQQKTLSGKASHLTLDELLQSISKIPKLNISVVNNYSTGYENCEKQFKMDYQICFHDFADEKWLIKPTSSVRSDRIYGNEFFAQNIKIIDPTVSKIFIVIPDSVSDKEIKSKNAYSKKIHGTSYVSFLDDILTFSELRDLILEHASENLAQGISANILGNNAEETISQLLNDKTNLLLWNDYEKHYKLKKSSTFRWFKDILESVGFNSETHVISTIFATKDIPKLSNGGYPKTDVAFTLTYSTRANSSLQEKTYTISVKNTTADTVTLHEGDISDVISALNLSTSSPLALALQAFQQYGSVKGLQENNLQAYEIINDQLPIYNEQLIRFFVFGVNSPLVTNDIQIADVLLYTTNFEVITRDYYVKQYLESYQDKGQLGTPFKWTYPSKKRGQKVQIKGFTNNKK